MLLFSGENLYAERQERNISRQEFMGQKISLLGGSRHWERTWLQFHLSAVVVRWVFLYFHAKLSILIGERVVQIQRIRRGGGRGGDGYNTFLDTKTGG